MKKERERGINSIEIRIKMNKERDKGINDLENRIKMNKEWEKDRKKQKKKVQK